MSRRVDAQQQKVVNGLNPGDQTALETTIGYEQVAVDLTAWLARHEPDPMLKQALDFALLEDFDHLYRYANLYELIDGKDAAALTGQLTEIMPGRPPWSNIGIRSTTCAGTTKPTPSIRSHACTS